MYRPRFDFQTNSALMSTSIAACMLAVDRFFLPVIDLYFAMFSGLNTGAESSSLATSLETSRAKIGRLSSCCLRSVASVAAVLYLIACTFECPEFALQGLALQSGISVHSCLLYLNTLIGIKHGVQYARV